MAWVVRVLTAAAEILRRVIPAPCAGAAQPAWSLATGIWVFAAAAFLELSLIAAAIFLFVPVVSRIERFPVDLTWAIVALSSSVLVGTFLVAVSHKHLMGGTKCAWARALGVPRGRKAWLLVGEWTILLFVLFEFVQLLISVATGECGRESSRSVHTPSYMGAIVAIDLVLFSPIVEEFMFRLLLYGTLRIRLGVAPAAILSGFIFAMNHSTDTWSDLIAAVSAGAVLAFGYEYSRSLCPPVFCHSLHNLVSLLWR
jgi:membrane protease YdiL (CAAX protease family)